MIPRLPVKMPLCGIATISPNGVTRFCKGIGSESSRRRNGAGLGIDRKEPVETQQLLEQGRRLQKRRLTARFADELQAHWPAELIETARNCHGGTCGERDHRSDCRTR